MKLLSYIFVMLFLFSCSKQKEDTVEEVLATEEKMSEHIEEVLAEQIETEAAYESTEEINEVLKNNKTGLDNYETAVNKEFVQQQLQEIINLIGLKNSADLVDEIQKDLKNTIDRKVESIKISNDLGIIKVTKLNILKQNTTKNKTIVLLNFEVKTTDNQIEKGKANAIITNEFIQVDDVIYTDYQIYFDNIEIK